MPRIVEFNVINRVTQNTGQRVLVFLTPTNAVDSPDSGFAAWQILNPSANGGSQPFTFTDSLQLAVEDQETRSSSARIEVGENQLYTVTNENNQGPVLNLSDETPPSAAVTAVTNRTDPAIPLNALWFVHGSPVVSQGFNRDTTVSFQLASSLFFMVAIPVLTGFGYRLQQFSAETRYIIPPGTNRVVVTWSRPGGLAGSDVLTFDPPSAPLFEGSIRREPVPSAETETAEVQGTPAVSVPDPSPPPSAAPLASTEEVPSKK